MEQPRPRDVPLAATKTKSAARPLAVVILAAGKGKRMKSKLPKVLHEVCGKPALWHVLRAAQRTRPTKIIVVVHHQMDLVEEAVRSWNVTPRPLFVDQGEPLGTGHAVMVTESHLVRIEDVLVMPGDEPLVTGDMLADLMKTHRRSKSAATMLAAEVEQPKGFGRIVRSGDVFERIAEEKDASAAEREVNTVATAIYAFRRPALFAALPLVGTDNMQREYYLPDVLEILQEKGEPVAVRLGDFGGTLGINSRVELARSVAVLRSRINRQHMDAGVTIIDALQTYIDVGVKIDEDTVLHPQSFLEGDTKIGADCEIGPSTRLRDTHVGDRSTVAFSVVTGAKIGCDVGVGPWTHLRPGTVLKDGSRAGSFTELKGAVIGEGSKVPHLSYVGDAKVGDRVNIGAGTVTVNYDGYEKHMTVIGDDARIGSDSMLVAPLRIGKGAVTGAGSVITKDVPAGALAVERGEQRQVKGYRTRKDADRTKTKTKTKTKATTKTKSTTRATKGKG